MKPPLRVFCCYARKDQKLLLELKETYLKPLERNGQIEIWADVDINAGLPWEREIEKHLSAAHIILLLVSPHFMASDYAYSKEMTQAIERHECGEARVIPIILHATDNWQETDFGKLQALPKDGRPVTDWRDRNKAFQSVVVGIREAIKQLTTESSVDSTAPLSRPPVTIWSFPWNQAVLIRGCTLEPRAEVVILGGDITGPFPKGGVLVWTREVDLNLRSISDIYITIYTNGEKFLGKGIHSTKYGRGIGLWVSGKNVYEIKCEVQDLYGDYWPAAALPGSAKLTTGWLHIDNLSLSGTVELKVQADPHVAADIHSIEVKLRANTE